MCDREPNEVGKVKREDHLRDREERFERHVFAATPRLGFALDAVFRGAGEIRFVIEDGFENRASVIQGKTDAECEEGRQEEDFFHPGARIQFALGANVEDRDGAGGGQEDRDIDEQCPQQGRLRPAGGGMEKHA